MVYKLVPTKFFLTSGMGVHKEKLQSFEYALRDAKIANFNLVSVSSILPPHCEELSVEEGLKYLEPGQIVFVVLARNSSDKPKDLISTAIGVAKPRDPNSYGYLSEHHTLGHSIQEAMDYAEDLAATMLASTLGIKFDADADYDERKEIYRMSGEIVESKSIARCAQAQEGLWTTVVSAAVLIIEPRE